MKAKNKTRTIACFKEHVPVSHIGQLASKQLNNNAHTIITQKLQFEHRNFGFELFHKSSLTGQDILACD